MKRAFDVLVIFFMTLFAHGLMLLNRGLFWDDWLWYAYWATNNPQRTYELFIQCGVPVFVYYWRIIFTYFPDPILGQRIISFVFIFLVALMIYWILQTARILSRVESLMVVALSLSYPVFQNRFQLGVSQYLLSYFVFCLAAFLTTKSEYSSRFARWGLRLVALALFYLSFDLNSLLVFFYGFLLFCGLLFWQKQGGRLVTALLSFTFRHIDYFILPFVYWVIKKLYFPTYGECENYNIINLSISGVGHAIFRFFKSAIVGQLGLSFLEIVQQPLLWLVLVIAVVLLIRFKVPRSISFHHSVRPYALVGMGVMMLGLGMFPYAVVGKFPLLNGYSTRHAMLLSLPMALILIGLIRLVFTHKDGFLSTAGWICFVILFLGFNGSNIHHYINWQERWIKDQSIILKLRAANDAKKYSIFWIDDQFPLIEGESYRYYEWSSMFTVLWGDEKWIGLPHSDQEAKTFFTSGMIQSKRLYNYMDLDVAGCQAEMIIRPGSKQLASSRTVLEYFYYLFLNPEQLDSFLEPITSLDIEPYSSSLATNCTP